jgi:N6-adenosine-specific RNA methylase IME4
VSHLFQRDAIPVPSRCDPVAIAEARMSAEVTRPKVKPAVDVKAMQRALAKANDPAAVLEIETKLDLAERYMRDSGLYADADIRPVNETRMTARWKLGRLLAEVERGHGPGRGKKKDDDHPSFLAYLKQIKLDKQAAILAQRIGTLPEGELEKAFARAHKDNDYLTYNDLIEIGRPYWYQASRQRKHQKIVELAAVRNRVEKFGPTLTYEQIRDYEIAGRRIEEIAHKDAVLFMWCTSANLRMALDVVEAWGFTYKAHAVWVKDRAGTGLVFRNRHEPLIYATRGKMPGPQFQAPSVFEYPRGRHSEKPAEIRQIIEKMYPNFKQADRLELFARGNVKGWTTHGYESASEAAE